MSKNRIIPLSEIGEIITGNTPKTSDTENYESNDIPFLKPSDFSTDNIDLFDTEFYISEKARNKARVLPVGSIVVTCIGIIGKTKITQKECAFNQQINAIIPFDGNNNRYIAYAISFQKELLQTKANAAVVPIINKTEFSKISIPLPPLETQCQIAANLDKVTHTIDLCNAILEKLNLLVKSRFVEMFGDKKYPYQELISLIIEGAGLSYGIVQPGDDGTGDMGVLRPVDIVDGSIVLDNIKFIDREITSGYQKTELTGKELLITVRGTTGVTAVSDKRFCGMNVTRGIAVIRYDEEKINPIYLNEYLKSDESQRYIKENTRGATLKQINLSDLRIQKILVPPLELQQQFAAFVEQIDKSKLAVKQVLEKAETLKNALMQEYFG